MCKWAIRSWKSCCSKRASKRWHTGAVVGIQDMGAAGLTSTSCEMASRGGVGIEIELARVPQRETGMTPYEMMLSESQERMLLVAERGREQEVFAVFAQVGTRRGGDRPRHGRRPAARAASRQRSPRKFPRTRWPKKARSISARSRRPRQSSSERRRGIRAAGAENFTENFRKLLAAPAIASKRWIFEQYDHMVRTNTLAVPGRRRRRRRAPQGHASARWR